MPQRTSTASRWHKAPETGAFPGRVITHLSLCLYFAAEICALCQPPILDQFFRSRRIGALALVRVRETHAADRS